MKAALVTVCLALALAMAVWAEPVQWTSGGDVVVNGKTLPNVHFLKQDRHLAYPIVAIASAVGKKVTFDAATNTLMVDGQKVTVPTLMVFEGVPYVGWRDLSKLIHGLDYGMEPTRAIFALDARKTMPTTQAEAPDITTPVVVVNKNDPGQRIDIKPFVVAGKTTVFEFFSEY